MRRLLLGFSVCFVAACLATLSASGQIGGSRAGVGQTGLRAGGLSQMPPLDLRVVEGYITMEGRAEVRVRPTEIRLVMAVTGEGETAQKCRATVDETIERLKTAWTKMGIAPENIVVDFIAILPRYAWNVEKVDDVATAIEKKVGYRMQTNIHLAVPSDSEAHKALSLAFEEGVTDIIAVDYWSKELDEIKNKAREQALKAAKSKSETLLGALFAKQPPVINVQEETTVCYPESFYQSFSNSDDETLRDDSRRGIPTIHASRPRNTYYRGLYSDGDVQPKELPMHPEISVISTIRLYYQSPAAAERMQREAAEKKP